MVICDLNMEPVDGVEFVKRIRAHPLSPNPFIPVVMVTAQTDKDTVVRARDAGISAFVAKPVTYNALEAKVKLVMSEDREFVRSSQYVGPDRRRRDRPVLGNMDRRKSSEDED